MKRPQLQPSLVLITTWTPTHTSHATLQTYRSECHNPHQRNPDEPGARHGSLERCTEQALLTLFPWAHVTRVVALGHSACHDRTVHVCTAKAEDEFVQAQLASALLLSTGSTLMTLPCGPKLFFKARPGHSAVQRVAAYSNTSPSGGWGCPQQRCRAFSPRGEPSNAPLFYLTICRGSRTVAAGACSVHEPEAKTR